MPSLLMEINAILIMLNGPALRAKTAQKPSVFGRRK